MPDRLGELAQADLRALGDDGDVLHAERSAVLGRDHRVFDVLYVLDQAHFLNVDLLQAGFDKASAGIGVVVGELLLHLADAESIGDQLVGVHANLVFARGAAEAGHIDDVGNGLEVLLHHPVFERLQLHHVIRRVGAVQREEIDLAGGAPVGLHLRRHAGGNRGRRKTDLRKPLERPLAVPGILFLVVENELDVGEAEQ